MDDLEHLIEDMERSYAELGEDARRGKAFAVLELQRKSDKLLEAVVSKPRREFYHNPGSNSPLIIYKALHGRAWQLAHDIIRRLALAWSSAIKTDNEQHLGWIDVARMRILVTLLEAVVKYFDAG